jgi:RNA polymerase sigma factor (TIGR02999 family)
MAQESFEPSPDQSISLLLAHVQKGDENAISELIPLVYRELRRLAAHYMRNERAGNTLQATELVHEAYLRLTKDQQVDWQGRAHFFAIAARSMRQILVERARRRKAERHGGGQEKVALDEALVFSPEPAADLVALDDALQRLEQISPRQSRVVELHFFGGLTFKEIATLERIGARTAEQDWGVARLWLHREVAKQG